MCEMMYSNSAISMPTVTETGTNAGIRDNVYARQAAAVKLPGRVSGELRLKVEVRLTMDSWVITKISREAVYPRIKK